MTNIWKCLTSPETREIQIKTAVKKCWPIKVVNTVLKFYIYSFKNEMPNMSKGTRKWPVIHYP